MTILYYITATLLYFVVGVVWSYVRWRKYFDDEIAFYEEEVRKFLYANRIRGVDIPDFLVFEWRAYVRGHERLKKIPPKAIDFRGEIVFDIVGWPLSMLFVFMQMVYKVGSRRILDEYTRMTNQKIEKIRKDLEGKIK